MKRYIRSNSNNIRSNIKSDIEYAVDDILNKYQQSLGVNAGDTSFEVEIQSSIDALATAMTYALLEQIG